MTAPAHNLADGTVAERAILRCFRQAGWAAVPGSAADDLNGVDLWLTEPGDPRPYGVQCRNDRTMGSTGNVFVELAVVRGRDVRCGWATREACGGCAIYVPLHSCVYLVLTAPMRIRHGQKLQQWLREHPTKVYAPEAYGAVPEVRIGCTVPLLNIDYRVWRV